MSMIADGPHHLRLCLHAEAMRKSIRLKPYMGYYFDLKKEFQKLYKRPTPSISDMLQCILYSDQPRGDTLKLPACPCHHTCIYFSLFRLCIVFNLAYFGISDNMSYETCMICNYNSYFPQYDWLSDLSIEADQSIDYGVRQAHDMANIIKRLLNDGMSNQLKHKR